jgi:hypothetical protein
MAHQEWLTKFDDQFSDLDHLWNLEIVSNVEQKSGWLKMQRKEWQGLNAAHAAINGRPLTVEQYFAIVFLLPKITDVVT